jgi:hypothetical protein
MPNTALTSPANPDEPYRLFDITIRAGIFHQNASEWLTEKERTCFKADGSTLSVSVEAGKLDALVYVLLHEATHVVDPCLRLTPAIRTDAKAGDVATEFTRGVWSDRLIHDPRYRDSVLDRVRYRPGGEVISIDQAESVYKALGRTPFVSLYGSNNWYDDLAEYAAVSHWTETLKQPFRIVIRGNGEEVFSYEPMKFDLVRQRLGQMKRFYAVEG